MIPGALAMTRLEAKRREQTPQALARLTVISLFIALWFAFWAARIPMPAPFLYTLVAEAAFFLVYWRAVFTIRDPRGIELANTVMLAAEVVFHTTMVYFLGGITWLGAFAYVFGLIFTNTFLGLRSGAVYTTGVALAFVSLALLDATGAIPHYTYLDSGARYSDRRVVATSIVAGAGVFYSIYLWVNWVGHQLRLERDTAVRMRDQLFTARGELERYNAELEGRVGKRTGELEYANTLLRARDELLQATIESTGDGILVVDEAGRAAHFNERFVQMWRIPNDVLATRDDDKLLQSVLDQLVDPEAFLSKVRDLYQTDREDLDTLMFKDGRIFERYSRPLLRGDDAGGRVWSFRDVTERERSAEQLRNQAQRDSLTRAYNHAAIAEVLRRHASHPRTPVAVVMADIDGMKALNDTYGHQVGDLALRTVAGALARRGAEVGRYGGDEFLAVIPGANQDDATAYCEEVNEELRRAPVTDPETGSPVPLHCSLGMALYPHDGDDVEDVVRAADAAMYEAKRKRALASDGLLLRTQLEDEQTAKIVGEIVPFLTTPGDLNQKLSHVAKRLCEVAGWDLVRFGIWGDELEFHTFGEIEDDLLREFDEHRRAPTFPSLHDETLRKTRRPIVVTDVQNDERYPRPMRDVMTRAGFKSCVVAPMLWGDELIGTIAVASRREGAIDARDVQLLTAIAEQVTAIVRMERLVDDLQQASSHLQQARADTVVLLAASAEAHDQGTGRHLQRVRLLSEVLARELGYSEEQTQALGLAAVLHDIGKIRVPEAILLSPSQLSDDEWTVMKRHTLWGAEFLQERPGFELAATIAGAHHERWDGTGYPQGLAGERIPETAAIVSVADSIDAMTNDRPYRAGRSLDWAVREVVRCAGKQFSPRVAGALLRMYLHHRMPFADAPDDRAAA